MSLIFEAHGTNTHSKKREITSRTGEGPRKDYSFLSNFKLVITKNSRAVLKCSYFAGNPRFLKTPSKASALSL